MTRVTCSRCSANGGGVKMDGVWGCPSHFPEASALEGPSPPCMSLPSWASSREAALCWKPFPGESCPQPALGDRAPGPGENYIFPGAGWGLA